MGEKVAVVLFNLGGPDSKAAIRPFLTNFFSDPAIIGLPQPFRGLLARFIAWRRTRREAGSSYARLGYVSPLLAHSQAQATALEQRLNQDQSRTFKVYVCMRYWVPRAREVLETIKKYAPDKIVLLPLYPQYSTTTTGSSLAEWQGQARQAGLTCPTHAVCCYPTANGFIQASVDLVGQAYRDLRARFPHLKPPRVLFSAHGLPEKIIATGDPYQVQCENTAAAIAEGLNIPGLDWQICYQSRVGPLAWIGPSTDEALQKAAIDQVPVVIYPHAFVSEHVETLVEIEEEYRHRAQLLGVPAFARVSTVMTHPVFIRGLADLVHQTMGQNPFAMTAPGDCSCDPRFVRCPVRTHIQSIPLGGDHNVRVAA